MKYATLLLALLLAASSGLVPRAWAQPCAAVTNVRVSLLSPTGATLSFGGANGASSYDIRYYVAGDSVNAQTLTTTTTTVILAGLQPATSYMVHVRTNCGPGLPAPVARGSFQTLQYVGGCGAVTNVAVLTTGSSTASVSFTPGLNNVRYTVRYQLPNDSVRVATGTASPILLNGLLPGATYYVQVVSQCGAGSSAVYMASNSLAYTFRSAGTLGVAGASGLEALALYPVPARQLLNVVLPAVPGATQADIVLLNTVGQPVRTQRARLTESGAKLQLLLPDVPPGLYVVQVRVGGQQVSRRVVVN